MVTSKGGHKSRGRESSGHKRDGHVVTRPRAETGQVRRKASSEAKVKVRSRGQGQKQTTGRQSHKQSTVISRGQGNKQTAGSEAEGRLRSRGQYHKQTRVIKIVRVICRGPDHMQRAKSCEGISRAGS